LTTDHVKHTLVRLRVWTPLLLAVAFFALAGTGPAEAAGSAYGSLAIPEAAGTTYGGLRLPYPAGQVRVIVRSTSHGPGRHAVDFAMSYEDVLAMHAGRVVQAVIGNGSYGNFIVLDHGDDFCAIYGHFSRELVKVGQSIQQGERIGISGNTGQSTGPHLHAAVFRKVSGRCAAVPSTAEVIMLFDEKPGRELVAGDRIGSQNRRVGSAAPIKVTPPRAPAPAKRPTVTNKPAIIATPAPSILNNVGGDSAGGKVPTIATPDVSP
jgi:murein DD-endopeptidase MepM/ murein hydrolase activator NlpD